MTSIVGAAVVMAAVSVFSVVGYSLMEAPAFRMLERHARDGVPL